MHEKIKGFDGLRALAVISVVLTHLGLFGLLESAGYLPHAVVPMIHGSTGVQGFFVLSGFLITLLLVKEMQSSGTVSIRKFIFRRILRIFPLYILFLVIATLLHIFGRNVANWTSLSYAYIYSYNFVPSEYYTTFIGHTWSLAVEEHFYLVWPSVFLLLFGRHRVALIGLLLTYILCAPALNLLLIKLGLGDRYFVERWSFVAGSSIALGCLLAISVSSLSLSDTVRRLAQRPGCLVVGCAIFANSLYLPGGSWFVENIGSSHLRAVGIALIIAWLFCNQTSLPVRMLEIGPLRYIGAISYGIYIFQGLFLDTGPSRDPSVSWPPDPSLGLVLLVLAAPFSYRYFEKPFLRMKDRYSVVKTRIECT